jgi:hypothetical protein
MISILHAFIWGASAMAGTVAAIFFARFYRDTKDPFFLFFCFAFLLLAADRVAITFFRSGEHANYVYLIRLAAFLLIIWAIVSRNRKNRPPG